MNEFKRVKNNRPPKPRDDDRRENNIPVDNLYNEVIEMRSDRVSKTSHAPEVRDRDMAEKQHPAETDHNEVDKMKKNQTENAAVVISLPKGTAVNIDGTWMCLAYDANARIIEDEAIKIFSDNSESGSEPDEAVIEQPQATQEEDGGLLGEILEQFPQGFYVDDVIDEIEEMELLGVTLPELSGGATSSGKGNA